MSPEPTPLEEIIARIKRDLPDARPFVVGLCGAQGSGKSTIAASLSEHFSGIGVPTAILSLDDLYRTQDERETLAREVHPLLRTRGVPGTHDVALGLATIDAILMGAAAPLPRFDKATDDRAPRAAWDMAPAGTRLVIFEGWCVGARPQAAEELRVPVNDLERTEDVDGCWRRYVNDNLAGNYASLFAKIDLLMLLAAPDFDTVLSWRIEQEHALRARTGRGMSDAEVARFVRHYERHTRHILAEMPRRADLTVRLDARRRTLV